MRRVLIVPVIAGILLTMSACGAKEETSSTPTTQASASSGDSDQSSTTEKRTTTTESGDDATDPSGDDSGTSGMPDLPSGLGGDCLAITTLYAGAMAQAASVFNPTGVSAAELDELAAQFEEAKAEVPDEIADAFDTWSGAWTEYMEALDGMTDGGMTDPANLEKLEQASEILDDPEVDAASKEIEAYIEKECGGTGGGLIGE